MHPGTRLQDKMRSCRGPHICVKLVYIHKFQDTNAETRRVYVFNRLLAHPCRHRGPKPQFLAPPDGCPYRAWGKG